MLMQTAKQNVYLAAANLLEGDAEGRDELLKEMWAHCLTQRAVKEHTTELHKLIVWLREQAKNP